MLTLRPYSRISTWLAMQLIAGRPVVIDYVAPPEKPDPSSLTTFQLLEELERRHTAFVFAGVTNDGEVEFDCNGGPLELYGLAKIAKKRANDEADSLLDDDLENDGDDEDLDDEPEGTVKPLTPVERGYAPAPLLAAPEPTSPVELIEMTPGNHVAEGYDHIPAKVTHLVGVPYEVGVDEPPFIHCGGQWRDNSEGAAPGGGRAKVTQGRADQATRLGLKFARVATKAEVQADLCRKRGTSYEDAIAPKVAPRPLVSTNFPRLPFYASTGRSFRLW